MGSAAGGGGTHLGGHPTVPVKAAETGHVLRLQPGPAEVDRRRHHARRRRLERGLAWGVPLVLLASWEVASRTEMIDRQLFPAPTTVVATGAEMARSGELFADLLVTLRRLVLGLGLGVGAGTAIGLAMGLSSMLRAGLSSLLSILYVIPKLALFPVLLLMFGVGDTATVLVVAMTVFIVMTIGTEAAVTAIPGGYREAAASLGATRMQLLRHVVVPASLPQVFVALRVSAGLAILVVVGAEFVHGSEGLGHLIWRSWSLYLPARMYVGVALVATLGVALAALVQMAARFAAPWRRQGEGGRLRRPTHPTRMSDEPPRPTLSSGDGNSAFPDPTRGIEELR